MELPGAMEILERAPRRVRLGFALSASMPCFAGHFEQLPVLAGVVQVDWAVRLARRHLALPGAFVGLQSVKFQKLIRPPAQMVLELVYLPERHALRFSYEHSRHGRATLGLVQMTGPQ